MQLLGSRVQNIQVPECSPEGRRNVGGKAAREQTLAWVSTDIYMLLYVFASVFFFSFSYGVNQAHWPRWWQTCIF
jgi:hypothetical protein